MMKRNIEARPTLPLILMAVYLVALFATLWHIANSRMLWFDELFTLELSRPAALSQLLPRLASGVDLNPPLSYCLSGLSLACLGESPAALRLPSIIGTVFAAGCWFAFVYHRGRFAEALLAMTAFTITAPIWVLCMEARPYGLMMGWSAAIFLAWQRRRAVAVAVIAFIGFSTHYYFVLPLLAVAGGELLQGRDRRMRIAIAVGFASLALFAPLFLVAPQQYAAGFWSKSKLQWGAAEEVWGWLNSTAVIFPATAALAMAMLCGRPRSGDVVEPDYPAPERTALAILALTPLFGIVIGKLTGAFHARYASPAVLGVAAIFARAVAGLSRPNDWPLFAAALLFATGGAAGQWSNAAHNYRDERRQHDETARFIADQVGAEPVMIDSPFLFARLWQEPIANMHPIFLADVERARAHTHSDTTDRGLLALSRVNGMPVVGFDANPMPKFYFGPPDSWRVRELESRGHHIKWVANGPDSGLYRIE